VGAGGRRSPRLPFAGDPIPMRCVGRRGLVGRARAATAASPDYSSLVTPRAMTDQKSRQAMRLARRPTLNRLGSDAVRAKRAVCDLRIERAAPSDSFTVRGLRGCRRLGDGLQAAVWAAASSRVIAAARAWISARRRSTFASCFSPLASQWSARSSWIRASSSCRSARYRPTAVSVPPVIPPPHIIAPHNVVGTSYRPAAPPANSEPFAVPPGVLLEQRCAKVEQAVRAFDKHGQDGVPVFDAERHVGSSVESPCDSRPYRAGLLGQEGAPA
jgi:hypothetical protein